MRAARPRADLCSAAHPVSQTASSPGDFTIDGRRDSIGLIEVPVTAGTYSGSWILDTGANLTIISQSVADQIGVEVSGTSESSLS